MSDFSEDALIERPMTMSKDEVRTSNNNKGTKNRNSQFAIRNWQDSTIVIRNSKLNPGGHGA